MINSKKIATFVHMAESVHRVLFVNSEIYPYLPESGIADIGRYLPQGAQERKKEIRSFMPRYGCINERKNQLHEVIRLSGMNIIISDVDRPLIIKVASISSARIQVYFIDNEDYFRRKALYCDAKGTFFKDNGERAIFFARGVLETVKKLRWSPDIVHCSGWMAHVLPLYLKKAYKDDPIFTDSKVVLSLYSDTPAESFDDKFAEDLLSQGICADDISALGQKPDGTHLAHLALTYSDGVVLNSPNIPSDLAEYSRGLGIPVLEYESKMKNGGDAERYAAFYETLK